MIQGNEGHRLEDHGMLLSLRFNVLPNTPISSTFSSRHHLSALN